MQCSKSHRVFSKSNHLLNSLTICQISWNWNTLKTEELLGILDNWLSHKKWSMLELKQIEHLEAYEYCV